MAPADFLKDVTFNSSRVDPSTYTVKLLDHSRIGLGGQMGGEREPAVIEHWTFANIDLAKKFAKLLIERIATTDDRIDAERDVVALFVRFERAFLNGQLLDNLFGHTALVDLLAVGVSLTKNKGDIIIQNFSYDQPTVARVTA